MKNSEFGTFSGKISEYILWKLKSDAFRDNYNSSDNSGLFSKTPLNHEQNYFYWGICDDVMCDNVTQGEDV